MKKGITFYKEITAVEFTLTSKVLNPSKIELEVGAVLLNLAIRSDVDHHVIFTSEGWFSCKHKAEEDIWTVSKMSTTGRALYDFTMASSS